MIRKVSEEQQIKNKEKAETTKKLHQLFREIWDEREDETGTCYCFESGRALPGYIFRGNSCCYDHVLEKNKRAYPEYAMVKKNIVILHPDIHQKKTNDIEKCPKVKAYRDYLLSLHEKDELKD